MERTETVIASSAVHEAEEQHKSGLGSWFGGLLSSEAETTQDAETERQVETLANRSQPAGDSEATGEATSGSLVHDNGQGSDTVDTVASILRKPKTGREVRLVGRIVKEIRYDMLLFDDGSGQIKVEVEEDDDFPVRLLKRDGSILLKGEVQRDMMQKTLYIDLDSARALPDEA
jgi:uncharacterized protein YdeI (BOF family)